MRTRIIFKKNVALLDCSMLSTINLRLEKYVLLICLENLLHLMAQKRYLETSMFGL